MLRLAASRGGRRCSSSVFSKCSRVEMPFQWLALPRLRFQSTAATAPSSLPTPENVPADMLVDEEILPGYNRKAFYEAHPGEVLDGRYVLKAKIGWGSSSTVWLAEDTSWKSWLQRNKYAALKINTCDNARDEDSSHELDMAKRIGAANSEHRGRAILCMATEAFSIQSPSTGSSHLCLAFEPMRDPLWLLRRRVCGERVTRDWLPMFKIYIQILLEGLDYLHSECKVVHTDLKLDNIMMTFEDAAVLEAFVQAQATHPMARKTVDDHVVYRCHNNFGDISGRPALKKIYPKITDFGLAQPVDQHDTLLLHPIQTDHCHAPEVLLGTSWSYPADMWNFGIMVWDLLAGRTLFHQDVMGEARPYNAAQHLAEMIAILGPVPEALVQREREMRHWRWSPEVRNAEGKMCGSAAEYFGGPFFTDNGDFVRKDLIPSSREWANEVPECVPEQDQQKFLAFMKRMLRWLPEERATAKELKDDPWFDIKL